MVSLSSAMVVMTILWAESACFQPNQLLALWGESMRLKSWRTFGAEQGESINRSWWDQCICLWTKRDRYWFRMHQTKAVLLSSNLDEPQILVSEEHGMRYFMENVFRWINRSMVCGRPSSRHGLSGERQRSWEKVLLSNQPLRDSCCVDFAMQSEEYAAIYSTVYYMIITYINIMNIFSKLFYSKFTANRLVMAMLSATLIVKVIKKWSKYLHNFDCLWFIDWKASSLVWNYDWKTMFIFEISYAMVMVLSPVWAFLVNICCGYCWCILDNRLEYSTRKCRTVTESFELLYNADELI